MGGFKQVKEGKLKYTEESYLTILVLLLIQETICSSETT